MWRWGNGISVFYFDLALESSPQPLSIRLRTRQEGEGEREVVGSWNLSVMNPLQSIIAKLSKSVKILSIPFNLHSIKKSETSLCPSRLKKLRYSAKNLPQHLQRLRSFKPIEMKRIIIQQNFKQNLSFSNHKTLGFAVELQFNQFFK